MATATALRGRPKILQRASVGFPSGETVGLALVGQGDTVQIALPDGWSLTTVTIKSLKSGTKTEASFERLKDATAPAKKKGKTKKADEASDTDTGPSALEIGPNPKDKVQITPGSADGKETVALSFPGMWRVVSLVNTTARNRVVFSTQEALAA